MFSNRSFRLTQSLLLLGLSAVLFGCSTSGGARKSANTVDLTGHWYGQASAAGEVTIWLNKRVNDGKFVLEFKKCEGNKQTFEQIKNGRWTQEGDEYTTITSEISDGKKTWYPSTATRTYVETYEIDKLRGNILYYSSDEAKYTARKVPDFYKLECGKPPAELAAAPTPKA